MAGLLRTLSGHDDLVDGVLSSCDGKLGLSLAMSSECRTLLGLPEVQRYFDFMWTGEIDMLREQWAEESRSINDALEAQSQVAAANEASGSGHAGKALRRKSTLGRLDADNSGTITFQECIKYAIYVARRFLPVPLAILFLPILGLFPPLEHYGARSSSAVLRAFNPSPSLRFALFA